MEYIDIKPPDYRHRLWMNGRLFFNKGRTYRILEGIWMVKNGELVDGIKFEEVVQSTENDEPVKIFTVPESEFFNKVTI